MMKKFIVLVNNNWEPLLWSDWKKYCDWRRWISRIKQEALELRNKYKKNFPDKYDYFEYFWVVNNMWDNPSLYFTFY